MALAALSTSAVASCGRTERPPVSSETASAQSAGAAPAPTSSADTSPPVTPPLPPLAGQRDVSELFVKLTAHGKGEVPAELLITDPRGRRTGVEPQTLRSLLEIPNASYDSAPPPTQTDADPEPRDLPKDFQLTTPAAGHYTIAAVGRKAGAYDLTVRIITPRGETREAAQRRLQIRDGEVQLFRFTHDGHTGSLTLTRQ